MVCTTVVSRSVSVITDKMENGQFRTRIERAGLSAATTLHSTTTSSIDTHYECVLALDPVTEAPWWEHLLGNLMKECWSQPCD